MNFTVNNFPVIEQLCHSPEQIVLLVLILGFAGLDLDSLCLEWVSFGLFHRERGFRY